MTYTTKLIECSDGCWAYIQLPGGWFLNNAGIIPGEQVSLIIDSLATRQLQADFLANISELVGSSELIVVNTHAHNDHVYGNCALPDSSIIVAHPLAKAAIQREGLSMSQLLPEIQWGDVSIKEPSVLVDTHIDIDLGSVSARVEHLGGGHTPGDLIIWIDRTRTVYTGDLVMSGVTPFFLAGSPAGAQKTLHTLKQRQPTVVIPGHGEVGGIELIDANLEYIDRLLAEAQQLIDRNIPVTDFRAQPDIHVPTDWVDAERHWVNLYAACVDLSPANYGDRVDFVTALKLLGTAHLDVPASTDTISMGTRLG
jgi:cyclase